PVDSDAAGNAVDENVAIGTTVGVTAFASDADATANSVSYAITGGTAAAPFAVDAASGVVTTAAALDREALGASRTIVVTATSAYGSTADTSFPIATDALHDARPTTPVDSDAAGNAVDENVAIGTTVGVTAFASDADATANSVKIGRASCRGDALFAVDAASGVVNTAAALDREALGASRTIVVTATSA